MLKKVDVTIEMISNKFTNINMGDILVRKWETIKDLLMIEGPFYFEKINQMKGFLIYSNFVFALQIFYYQFYCNFDSVLIYTSSQIFYFNIFYVPIIFIIILTLFQKDLETILSSKSKLLNEKFYDFHSSYISSFIINIIPAYFDSIIIFFVNISINSSEKSFDFIRNRIFVTLLIANLSKV